MPVRLLLAGTLPYAVAALLILARPFLFGSGWPWLLFNLGLAWFPLLLVAPMRPGRSAAWLVPWLLFLPNAPYLISDLIHYAARPPVPAWFDAAMLGATGAAGLAGGALSVAWAARCLRRWGTIRLALAGGVVCLLAGRAIELGRVQRHHSIDLILSPAPVLQDLLRSVLAPVDHAQVWAITLVYAAILAAWSAAFWGLAPLRSVADPATPP